MLFLPFPVIRADLGQRPRGLAAHTIGAVIQQPNEGGDGGPRRRAALPQGADGPQPDGDRAVSQAGRQGRDQPGCYPAGTLTAA